MGTNDANGENLADTTMIFDVGLLFTVVAWVGFLRYTTINLVWIIGNPEEILTAVQVCSVCGKVLRRLPAALRLTIIIVWQDFFLNVSPCCESHSGRFIGHEF